MFEMQIRRNNKVRKNTSKGSKAAVVLSLMSLLLIFATVENAQGQILTPAEQLNQTLLAKCMKMQKWYDDVGISQDFKCVEYADAWSSLIK